MDLAKYLVNAVVLEKRSYREVAAAHGVSKSWVAKLVARYQIGGYEAIRPRSKAPLRTPHRTSPDVEDRIIALRKFLQCSGFDAGAQTISYFLSKQIQNVPSVSTIWRVLRRRGLVVAQPHKRPRSSWNRFEAQLPNQCWQSDATHWALADGSDVEIVNYLDDYSRIVVASKVFDVATAPRALSTFLEAAQVWGLPASVLTDNGCIYTAAYRNGRSSMESELLRLGIAFKHSTPYHPQTCGKVERFHQTLKQFLAKQAPAVNMGQLQAQIDCFVAYYNSVRPHRARGRKTPLSAYRSRDKAMPSLPKIAVVNETRVRHDKVDNDGSITLRYRSKLHHIGIGRAHRGTRVVVLMNGLNIKVLNKGGEIIRRLTLDPSKNYQARGVSKTSSSDTRSDSLKNVYDVATHLSTMS